jgi:hypothetical protein
MRSLSGSLLILVSGLLVAQTSQELHSRYGDPDRERFVARPGISVTVEYGFDRLACEVLMEPPQPLLSGIDQTSLMSSDAVTEVLEEMVPLGSRGGQIRTLLTNSGCNQVRLTDYVHVSIMRSTHNCLPLKPEREMRATVTFKRGSCQTQRK